MSNPQGHGLSRHPVQHPPLVRLPVDEKIAVDADEDGDLLLRDLFTYGESCSTKQGYPLSGKQALALGLTEKCCDARRGKVFWCPIASDYTNERYHYKGTNPDIKLSYEAGLPQLVYIPFQWSETDRERWMAMNHVDRLELLNARAGGIEFDECVMPIGLTYEPEEKRRVRLNCVSDEHRGAKAALVVLPRPYLAWLPQMIVHGTQVEHIETLRQRAGDQWLVVDREALEPFAVSDWAGVVDKLDEMYHEGEPRSLMPFRRLLTDLVDFAMGIANKAFSFKQNTSSSEA